MDAREVALLTLYNCQRQGGWSDGVLKKQIASAGLDSRDAALATNLCFGVVQNQILLDFYLSKFSSIPLSRMENKVLQSLRLGVYQMLFLSKIPHSAAVDRSVAMVKQHSKNPRTSGMVNAILRNFQRSMDHLPTISKQNSVEYLSTLYSHPAWLVERILDCLGEEETISFLQANNAQTPITAQVNTTKTDVPSLKQRLEEEGVGVELHPWLTDCLILSRTGNLEGLSAFQEGLFYIQDAASRLAVLASGVQQGMKVLDTCAAPGGKSFACAIQMAGKGEIVSCDLHPHKKKLIAAGAKRLDLSIVTPKTADGKVFRPEWEEQFDCVLVDAPCSGLGVIRKKPDIRYKDPEPLAQLPGIQMEILENAARYVKKGGTLLYSTCTVLPCENEEIIQKFLENHSEFFVQPIRLPDPVGAVEDGMITLWPHRHGTDGFFIAKLRKGE